MRRVRQESTLMNPFFKGAPNTRPTASVVPVKEDDFTTEREVDTEGRPSFFDRDQQCGAYYVRNWAILLWALLAISVTSTVIAVIALVEYASLSQQQTPLSSAFVNVSNPPFFPPDDDTCILQRDLSPDNHSQHAYECTNDDPRILHQVILKRKPQTPEDAANIAEQEAALGEVVAYEATSDAHHANTLVNGSHIPLVSTRLRLKRSLAVVARAAEGGALSGVQQASANAAAAATSGVLEKVENVIHRSKWTQAIIQPFVHHHNTGDTHISSSHHMFFKHADGTVVHTIVKEDGGDMHVMHPELAHLVRDAHDVVRRATPILKTVLSAFVAGRRLNVEGKQESGGFKPKCQKTESTTSDLLSSSNGDTRTSQSGSKSNPNVQVSGCISIKDEIENDLDANSKMVNVHHLGIFSGQFWHMKMLHEKTFKFRKLVKTFLGHHLSKLKTHSDVTHHVVLEELKSKVDSVFKF